MADDETTLTEALIDRPEDWISRIGLLECLLNRGDTSGAARLLYEAPTAVDDEAQLQEVIARTQHVPELAAALRQTLAWFIGANPQSGLARLLQARITYRSGDFETALAQYRTARRLDASLSDSDLELLNQAALARVAASVVPAAAKSGARSTPQPVLPAQSPRRFPVPVPPKPAAPEPEPVPAAEAATIFAPADTPPAAIAPQEELISPEATELTELSHDSHEIEAPSTPEEPAPSSTGPVAEDEPAPSDSEKAETSATAPSIDMAADSGPAIAEAKTGSGAASESHVELIVTEGEIAHAHSKDPDTREKLTAVIVAIAAHLAAGIAFALLVVSQARETPPQMISSQISEAAEQPTDRPKVEKIQPASMPMAGTPAPILSANAFSSVAMPQIEAPLSTTNPLGLGDAFGPSLSLGVGKSGGAVSFFGSKAKSKKLVFVVDFSASMGGSKDELMRKELTKSIRALPTGVQYQVILFAGPAWYAGQKVGVSAMNDKWVANVVQDGSQRHVWYEGWDEKERHTGNLMTALYHYAEGQDRLPRASYISANRAAIDRTIKQIEDTPLVYGTDWRWPLRMAMNLRPDTIFFMTDGAFTTGNGVSKKEMIDELLDYNRKMGNARINTICMMVLQAREELEQLADGSRGEFTLVQQDGTVVRGGALDRVD
ncbi:MAG: hypothetical protein JNK37_02475 [Verrucomicrobiales bacterium]|nr:hypothetical protein [Verrucomicrobiales bacterium]